jgi:hypothetical protein
MVSKFKLKKGFKSINKLEELNPEVLKMLGNLYRKGTESSAETGLGALENPSDGNKKAKIVLSDGEFGKY